MKCSHVCLLLALGCFVPVSPVKLETKPDSQYIQVKKTGDFDVWLSGAESNDTVTLEINVDKEDVIDVGEFVFTLQGDEKKNVNFSTLIPGNAEVNFTVVANSEGLSISNLQDEFVHIYSIRSDALNIFNIVIGWIYFAAWSVSFYPQVIYNWQRKSVVGLNFDFLGYNLLGFSVYSVFNVGMYWVKTIQDEYHDKNPGSLIPVKLNDVIFSLHAVFITAVTIGQCFIYKRNNQTVSWFARVFIVVSLLVIIVLAIFTTTQDFKRCSWLNFINWIAYIKLAVSFIKYIPQAYMNYVRQSTVGWSIGNVILDFTGGSLSILQAVLLSYNSDDWASLVADPVKFGLGFLSIFFDLFFMFQHYVLYRNRDHKDYEPNGTYRIFENQESEPAWNYPGATNGRASDLNGY